VENLTSIEVVTFLSAVEPTGAMSGSVVQPAGPAVTSKGPQRTTF
jgi:hypothetical protein